MSGFWGLLYNSKGAKDFFESILDFNDKPSLIASKKSDEFYCNKKFCELFNLATNENTFSLEEISNKIDIKSLIVEVLKIKTSQGKLNELPLYKFAKNFADNSDYFVKFASFIYVKKEYLLLIFFNKKEESKTKDAVCETLSALLETYSSDLKNASIIVFDSKFSILAVEGEEVLLKLSLSKTLLQNSSLFDIKNSKLLEKIYEYVKNIDSIDNYVASFVYEKRLFHTKIFQKRINSLDETLHFVKIENVTSEIDFEDKNQKLAFKLYSILESISDALISFDEEWRITYLNKPAEVILRDKRENLYKRNFWDICKELIGSVFYLKLYEAFDKRESIKFEEYLEPFDAWYEINVYYYTHGLTLYLKNINPRKESERLLKLQNEELKEKNELIEKQVKELKQLNEALYKSKEELAQINESKDKLLSIVAHDLRNPFFTLTSFTELLLTEYDKSTDDEIEEGLKRIYQASRHIYRQMNDLLEWARYQGKVEFENEIILLQDIINDAISLHKEAAHLKNIKINVSLQENLKVLAQRNPLASAVNNLISNSIKFTNPGGEILIKAYEENDNSIIEVIDNGVGISKDNLKKLFKVGEKVTKPGTNNEKGTGLGLLICKEIVEKIGGKITIDSELGKGTIARIELPKHQLKKFQ
jgi:signal transduction histidine kinase